MENRIQELLDLSGIPQEKIEKYLEKAVEDTIEFRKWEIEMIVDEWLEGQAQRLKPSILEKYGLSVYEAPTKEEFLEVYTDITFDSEIKYAIQVINVFKSRDVKTIIDYCVNRIGWKSKELFKLYTGKSLNVSKTEAINIIKEYAGEENTDEYEKNLRQYQQEENFRLQKEKEEKEKQKKQEELESIKANISTSMDEEIRQGIAEDIFNLAYSQKPLDRGKMLQHFSKQRLIRYDVKGKTKIASLAEYIYDSIFENGYTILYPERKAIKNKEDYFLELKKPEYIYAEFLIKNYF